MSDGQQKVVLYGSDHPDAACVQVWPSWPYEVPKPGDVIRLSDGLWTVEYRLFDPNNEGVEVYAEPPADLNREVER